jgi:hypothetical protein
MREKGFWVLIGMIQIYLGVLFLWITYDFFGQFLLVRLNLTVR